MKLHFNKSRAANISKAAVFALTAFMFAMPVQAQNSPDGDLLQKYKNAPGIAEYPGAMAIILADDMTYTLNEDFSSETTEYNVIKILNKEGADTFKILPRSYDAAAEQVELISARTVSPEGKITVIDPKSARILSRIDESEANKNKKYFIVDFPNLSAGSLIEYKCRMKTAARDDKTWSTASYLQNDVPIVHSTFKVSVPENVKAHTFTNVPELKEPQLLEDKGKTVYYWQTSSPYDTEPSLPNKPNNQNYYKYVAVSGFADWPELGGWAGSVWAKNTDDHGDLNILASGLTSVSKTPEERIDDVLKYLNTHFITAQDSDLWHKADPALLSKSEKLSPSDAAYLAGCLLTKAGLNVTPYLVTNSDLRNIENLPPIPQYVEQYLLKVTSDGKDLWIDPSVPGIALNAPNKGWQGSAALELPTAVRQGGARLVALPCGQARDNLCLYDIAGNVNLNGLGELTADITPFGLRANDLYASVQQLGNLEPSVRQKTVEWIMNKFDSLFAFHFIPYSNYFPSEIEKNKPAAFSTTVKVNGCARLDKKSGCYLTPLTVINNRTLQAGLNTENRTCPIRFDAPFIDEISYRLTLPEESSVIAAPQNCSISNEIGSYICQTVSKGREVWFYNRVEINKPWIYPDEFDKLKELSQAQLSSSKTPLLFKAPKKAEKKQEKKVSGSKDVKNPETPAENPEDSEKDSLMIPDDLK
ncbi:DUF3857 domain-containing protein [bacterium]|nr:DUF3857 domain-containing protein [bacterium]